VTTTIWGSTGKPVSARRLAELLGGNTDIDGTLYIGYPVLGTPDGAFPFDALLLSPKYGLVAFDIVEGKGVEGFEARQDNIYAKLQSKLLQYPALVNRRELQADISVVTYAPIAQNVTQEEGYPLLSNDDLIAFLTSIESKYSGVFPQVSAAIQALTNIRKARRKRVGLSPDSRGTKLQALNDSIANLDSNQSAAVVETVDGVQRIRGLAGSGKTIVLALKVAYLHAQNPDWKIAVTFNTRSLKGQFERLINTFVIEQTNEEPDWSNIQILHSWGSPSSDGVYYSFCKMHGLPFRDFRSAQSAFGDGKEFEGICAEALNQVGAITKCFDAILIDEAQDLPSSFMKLCYALLLDPKRLVYAYDELQSLTDTVMSGPEELFGKGRDGTPYVVFKDPSAGEPRQDIILERCYRNSRPVLATAHALGFGIYREPDGLIQIFEQNELWLDVGYRVQSGRLTDGEQVSLARTPETSPKFLEEHSDIDDLIQFHAFKTRAEQDSWLVESITRNIEDEELLPEDVIVINPDPIRTRKMVGEARSALLERGINSSIAGVSTSPDVFFENDVVTFTGIFRAKGNEAGMVYVINADDCYHTYHAAYLTRNRNRLFTAITRSKAWVRVLGVGENMEKLKNEFESIKQHEFRLDFEYPTAEKKKQLRIVNRDLTQAERSRVAKKVDDLESVVGSLEAGDVRIEDVPEALRKRLAALLTQQ
jgi:superfamily I DNA and RNA helicase